MTSLEFINTQIAITKRIYKKHIEFGQTSFAVDDEKDLKQLHQIKTELETLEKIKNKDDLKLLDEIKYLCREGDIFSANGFMEDYESCLSGDGTATFVTKDLEVIEDFSKGWKLLEQDKIAFVAWFNR